MLCCIRYVETQQWRMTPRVKRSGKACTVLEQPSRLELPASPSNVSTRPLCRSSWKGGTIVRENWGVDERLTKWEMQSNGNRCCDVAIQDTDGTYTYTYAVPAVRIPGTLSLWSLLKASATNHVTTRPSARKSIKEESQDLKVPTKNRWSE